MQISPTEYKRWKRESQGQKKAVTQPSKTHTQTYTDTDTETYRHTHTHIQTHTPRHTQTHLFGAGHPLTIPFAVALGCDTFDSASYILYAKNDRYISEDRTFHLSKITSFSCPCEVCSKFTPKELQSLIEEEKINKLSLHNLISIKAEVDRVKEAIHEGRLWEYVIKKARAHPKLYETIEVFTANCKGSSKTI